MATLQQNLFNKWVELNYPELAKQMPMLDMMHSAYVTVYGIKRPILPTPERFHELMQDAYHRHMLREFNHSMHFILPDPLFWEFMDERPGAVHTDCGATKHSISELSTSSLRKIFSFVRTKFPEDVQVFEMAIVNQMSYSDIAKATGRSKAQVKETINKIEKAILEM